MADSTPTTLHGLDWLDATISGLAQANVAIPIVFTTITGMIQLYRAAKGEPPLTPDQLFAIADAIEAKVKLNDAYGKAEIARLTLLIEQRGSGVTVPFTPGNVLGGPSAPDIATGPPKPGSVTGNTPGEAGQPVP